MLKRNILFVLIVVFTADFLAAQIKIEIDHSGCNSNEINKNSGLFLSGNLNTDNKIIFDTAPNTLVGNLLPDNKDKKSPWLGTVFSLVLPGAGEFYAESYWKTGIFLAIEAAVITTAVIYNKKGNDETNTFQNFANAHWDAVRYAEWLVNIYAPSQGTTCTIDYDKVRRGDYSELHECENEFPALSHNLANYGEQQYYEMIGKYDQFSSGWDDFNPNQQTTAPISANFKYYSGLRGKANNYYAVASTAVIGIYLNHFLSAIDAYWSTSVYNKDLNVSMSVNNERFADNIILVPTVNFKLSF